MDNINQITTTVLIDEILDSTNSDFARAIMTGYVFSDLVLNQEKVKIIFSENNEARRTRGVQSGDILFIYGSIGYTIEDQVIIYASSFIVLSKNTNNLTANERKIIFMPYSSLPSKVILEGIVANTIEDSSKCFIDIHRNQCIRGEIKERDVIPCVYVNNPDLSNEDNVIINGFIKDNMIYGTIKKTC